MREIDRRKAERWWAIFLAVSAVLALPVAGWAAEVDINVVENSKNDNGFLDDAAGHFGNPVRATDKADLIKKVLARLGEGDCIKTLTLAGHGSPGNISTGDGQKVEKCKHINGNGNDWKTPFKALQGKFCAGAKIVIWGCNVGACNEGASKLHEISQFFGVRVEAQTGFVYGNGTTQEGSQTQVALPTDTKPPAHKSAPSECKKKKKPGEDATATTRTGVPVAPAVVTFPSAGTPGAPQPVPVWDILSVSFVPAAQLDTVFEETDPTRPFLETATISVAGDLYLAERAVQNRSIVEAAASGVFTDSVADTRQLGANLMGAVVFQLADGRKIPYYTFADFQHLLSGADFANALSTTCDGIALYRLMTWETLPYTILDAHLDPEAETALLSDLVLAANQAEQGLIVESHATLDRLISRTEQLSPETATRIEAEAATLKADYALLVDEVAEPAPDPDPGPTPRDPVSRTPDDSGKRRR